MDISSIKVPNGNTYTFKDTVARKRMTEITWSNLVSLRNHNQLIPGMQYRITDYHCTTSQEDTRSANHQFDIIVTADSTNKLNESARAIQHNGDTYFSNCNLAAWKIWYCLDNDTTRFAWADATNGKGIIYRMIDEFNNDCPYDFKNIQFKRYKITGSGAKSLKNTYLACEYRNAAGVTIDNKDSVWCYTFNGARIKGQDEEVNYDENVYEAENLDLTVAMAGKEYYSEDYSICHSNVIKQKTSNDDSNSLVIILNNIVLNGRFADKQSWMEFGDSITDTAICPSCNLFGFDCCFNSFGNGCSNNIFGNGCRSNIFGNNLNNNRFGNSYKYNEFGDNCNTNSFGDGCYSNIFGDYCNANNFGINVYSNSFGDDCYNNSFGNNCHNNSFGNNCHNNRFGVTSSGNKLNAYYQYNTFENGVQNVEFSGVGTNYNNTVQNYHIKQGMSFTNGFKHTIIAKAGLNYELTIAKQSDGTVVEYCEADLLKSIQTSTITTSAKSNLD